MNQTKIFNLINLINSDELIITKTIFSIFANPKQTSNKYPPSYHLISSHHYEEFNDKYDLNSACDFLNKLEFNKIIVISITKNPKYDKVKRNEYFGINPNKNTIIIEYIIHTNYFWTDSLMKILLSKNSKNFQYMSNKFYDYLYSDIMSSDFTIYKFNESTYFEIVSRFNLLNISISGGSDTKRNIPGTMSTDFNTFLLALHQTRLRSISSYSFYDISDITIRNWFNYNLPLEEIKKTFRNLELEYLKVLNFSRIDNDTGQKPSKNKIRNLEYFKEMINLIKLNIIQKEKREEKLYNNVSLKNTLGNSDEISNNESNNPFNNNAQKREYHSSLCLNQNNLNNPFNSIQKRSYHSKNNNNLEYFSDIRNFGPIIDINTPGSNSKFFLDFILFNQLDQVFKDEFLSKSDKDLFIYLDLLFFTENPQNHFLKEINRDRLDKLTKINPNSLINIDKLNTLKWNPSLNSYLIYKLITAMGWTFNFKKEAIEDILIPVNKLNIFEPIKSSFPNFTNEVRYSIIDNINTLNNDMFLNKLTNNNYIYSDANLYFYYHIYLGNIKDLENYDVEYQNIELNSKNNLNPFSNSIQKREYHSINFNPHKYLSTRKFSNIKKEDINKDILIEIENLIKKNKFKKILKRLEYISINELIHNRKNLTESQKQFEIETFYISTIRKRIEDIIKSPKFLNTNDGYKLLNRAIRDLDEKLSDFKKPNFLNRKRYAWVFANLDNSLIISVTFSILIPLIYSKINPLEQNYTNIIYKLGKNLYKAYLSEHYIKYLQIFYSLKDMNDKETNIIEYKIVNILNKKEIILEINGINEKIEYQNFVEKICFSEITEDVYYEIGHDIIQYLDLTTDYIKIETFNYGKENRFTIILPGKTIDELIDISLMDVSMLPMICKPNNWIGKKVESKVNNNIILNKNIKKDENYEKPNFNGYEYKITRYGGYLLNNDEHNHFIHKTPINASIIKLINDDIINTINYIQSVPFQINLNVLHRILSIILENKNLDDPFFFSIHNETKKLDEYKRNKELSKVNEILRQNSLANINLATLSAAILLRKNTFYNPIYTDWRGRIYANNTLLSFQGSELNRALLYFTKGNILNERGFESLKIYTANCFGLSKLSRNYRINWFNNNIKKYLNIDSNHWLEAKEKLLFLACIYEVIEYYKDPNNFISKLPIFLDATASGLQHLSVMTKDLNLARYVNILKASNNENPYDVYSLIGKKVSDIIKNIPDFNTNSLIKKLAIAENREFTKWPTMTTSYGVTLRGVKDQLISNIFLKTDEKYRYNVTNKNKNLEKVTNMYKLKDIKYLKDEYKDEFEIFKLKGTEIMYLAKIIHNTLYDSYPSLKLLVKYLKDINNFLSEISLEIGIIWNTPSGLILEQKYLETVSEQKTKSILGRRKSYTIQKTIPKINKTKQKRGTMPNLIHSMDAGNISLLVNILIKNNNNINLVTVHDCFLTDSNNIDMLHFHVRLAFLKIYQNQDFIENFHNNLITYLKNLGIKFNENNTKIYLNDNNTLDIPVKPNFSNNLDLSYNLFNSPYFIN